ncbi:hypothetical protein [Mycobacterium interjectum]|uniref:hypothetical protein n=1 Tax=Mycobacterium interjectum TaxID=33895 RepID=UPI001359CEAD|nr:hypothetical protein [Mycobacterium interjectum]MCV7089455.1 hypothetical protein [Mycobacterium interjectum]
MARLQLTENDARRLSMIDPDDPGVKLACEQTAEKARHDWQIWEQWGQKRR